LKIARTFFLVFLVGWLVAVDPLLAGAPVRVKGIQLKQDGGRTRIAVELSGPVRYSHQTLAGPDRLVVDLRNTRLDDVRKADVRGGPVATLRHGIRNGTDLRLVLDLAAPAPAEIKLVGNLLLIELQGGGAVAVAKPARPAPPPASPGRPVKAVDVAGQRDIIIAIDAGHGGNDPGAIGPGRVQEKQVVLAIARELKALVERERGYRAIMTRNNDTFLPLKTRRDLARRAQADLFVSIHADAFTNPRARGGSVYALSTRGATSTMAGFLANSENNADAIGGVSTRGKDDDLVKVLADLSLTASMDASMRIGGHVLSAMSGLTHLHSRRVEQAGFMVLKSPDTPSILVETGFISNPEESRKLASSRYQQQMARSIFSGIHRHFSQSPPPNTYLAWVRRNGSRQQAAAVGGDSARHIIARGDTLSGLAQRYGVPESELRRYNRLDSSVLRIGQTIQIPTTDET
jgi:N-acetylmuramoyl-L-alanine amidase